jgi:F-type H+-transporting ATPase subunit delta
MSKAFHLQEALADPYADALFALARDENRIDEIRAELEELVRIADEIPELAEFWESPALDDDYRAAALEKAFRGRVSDMVLNTMQVLNANGRHGLLRALLRGFVIRQEEAEGQVEATATSAVELSPDQRKEVERVAAQLSGKKPLVEFKVDPSILGGLILQIADWRYDNSIAQHLRTARHQILERSKRGLSAAAPS